MIHLLLAVIYVSFISLGLPDSLLGAAWPSIYQGLGVPVSYSGVIFRRCYSHQRCHDRRSTVRVLCQQLILGHVPVGDPLWTWGWKRGCSTQ